MKRWMLTVYCWLSLIGLYAQADFRPGFVVTHANDTVSGFVQFTSGGEKAEHCVFRRINEATLRRYTAAEINGFGFADGRRFVSKQIKSHANTFEAAFVELIVQGRVSLFRGGDGFYVSKADSDLYALRNEITTKTINGRRVAVESNRHVGVLSHLMSDCDDVKRKIAGIKLYEKPLTALVEDYNVCHNVAPRVSKVRLPFLDVSVSASGGVSINTLKLRGDLPAGEALQGEFGTSVSPYAGISFDLSSPRINDRMAFHVGASYVTTHTKSFHEVAKGYYMDRHFVTIDMTSLQILLGIQYAFAERRLTPYVNAGIVNTYNASSKVNWIRETEVDRVVETRESDDIQINRNQVGLWSGVGVRKRIFPSADIFLEFRYSKSLGSVGAAESVQKASPTISGLQSFLGIRTR